MTHYWTNKDKAWAKYRKENAQEADFIWFVTTAALMLFSMGEVLYIVLHSI